MPTPNKLLWNVDVEDDGEGGEINVWTHTITEVPLRCTLEVWKEGESSEPWYAEFSIDGVEVIALNAGLCEDAMHKIEVAARRLVNQLEIALR
jgi:hypothetical protein